MPYEYTQTIKITLDELVSATAVKQHMRTSVHNYLHSIRSIAAFVNPTKVVTVGKCDRKEVR